MTNQPSDIELYQAYALRLQADSHFMAFVLRQYQLQEKLSDEALAQQLNVSPTNFLRLAMCRRPSDQAENYTAQVRRIAGFALVNELELFRILRQVESMEAIGHKRDDSQFLSAARDHESDPKE